jgi:hypothetical protein
MHKPLLASILHREAWEWGGKRFPPPHRFPRDDEVEANTEGVGKKILSAGFFSGLVPQSEIDDLLDMLYGSYGERLMVTYKVAS